MKPLHFILLTSLLFTLTLSFSFSFPTPSFRHSLSFLSNIPSRSLEDSKNAFNLVDYLPLLKRASFFGDWHSLNSKNPRFTSFESTQGIFTIEAPPTSNINIAQNIDQDSGLANRLLDKSDTKTSSQEPVIRLVFQLYDGKYLDRDFIKIRYDLNSTKSATFDPTTATIHANNAQVTKYLNENQQYREEQLCKVNLSIAFLSKSDHGPFKDPAGNFLDLAVKVNIASSDCQFDIEAPFMTVNGFIDNTDARVYALFGCVMALVNIFGVHSLKRLFKRKQEVFNISLASVWLTVAIDYYILIINLVLVFSYSSIVAIPFALNCFLTFVLEKSLLTRILYVRSRRRGSAEPFEDDCRSCSWHFALAALFFIFLLVFVLLYQMWVLHFTALVLLPQIFQNTQRVKPYAFNIPHVAFIVAPKILFIIYLKMCPFNIFKLSPEPGFVGIYFMLLAVQVLTTVKFDGSLDKQNSLQQQSIPEMGLATGKVLRKASRMLCDEDICPICMGHLSCSNMDISPTLPRRPTIETTCTHNFHVPCLRKWAKTKTECPLCRYTIEDILEELDMSDDEEESGRNI